MEAGKKRNNFGEQSLLWQWVYTEMVTTQNRNGKTSPGQGTVGGVAVFSLCSTPSRSSKCLIVRKLSIECDLETRAKLGRRTVTSWAKVLIFMKKHLKKENKRQLYKRLQNSVPSPYACRFLFWIETSKIANTWLGLVLSLCILLYCCCHNSDWVLVVLPLFWWS